MIEVVALPQTVQAALLVVVVLLEAIVFYVGYGAVERIAAPSVIGTIENA